MDLSSIPRSSMPIIHRASRCVNRSFANRKQKNVTGKDYLPAEEKAPESEPLAYGALLI